MFKTRIVTVAKPVLALRIKYNKLHCFALYKVHVPVPVSAFFLSDSFDILSYLNLPAVNISTSVY